MELGGQVSDAEIGQLEKTLRLAPGQLKSSMVTDPATGISKIPSRLERESGAALGTFEKKARIEEKLKGEFAPAEVEREKKKIETLGPAQTAQAVALTKGTEQAKADIDVKKQERLIEITRKEQLRLIEEKADLELRLAEKNLPAETRIDLARKLAAADAQISVNKKLADQDPKLKAELDKLAAESEAKRAEATKDTSIAGYYDVAKSDESKARAEKLRTDTTKPTMVKMAEVNEYLVQAGAAEKDDKGKIRPVEMDKDDPKIPQILAALKEQGITAEALPVTAGWARQMVGQKDTGKVTITVSPGAIGKTAEPKPATDSSKSVVGVPKRPTSSVIPKTRAEYKKALKVANPGASDAELEAYLDKEGIK